MLLFECSSAVSYDWASNCLSAQQNRSYKNSPDSCEVFINTWCHLTAVRAGCVSEATHEKSNTGWLPLFHFQLQPHWLRQKKYIYIQDLTNTYLYNKGLKAEISGCDKCILSVRTYIHCQFNRKNHHICIWKIPCLNSLNIIKYTVISLESIIMCGNIIVITRGKINDV